MKTTSKATKYNVLIIMLIMLLITMLCSCTDTGNTSDESDNRQSEIADTVANTTSIIDILYDNTNSNTIVSGTSLNIALGMLAEGSDTTTRNELEEFFGTETSSLSNRYKTLGKIYDDMENAEINLANGLWVNSNEKIKLKEEYEDRMEELYEAEIDELDFSKESSVAEINDWCKNKTNGLIDEIVDSSISLSSIVGANALYFNCEWEEPFSAAEPYEGWFTGIDGRKMDAEIMSSTEKIYIENETATGFIKPYKEGLQFVGILPKEEGEFSMKELDIKGLIDNQSESDVMVCLPKFKAESNATLDDPLMELGLKEIFTSEADLSKMVDGERVFVDSIFQKTYIDVNETGTEAAAVTGFALKSIAAPNSEVKEVYIDRPFAFAIYDSNNDEFLFIGKIVEL